MSSKKLGDKGELIAIGYLKRNGYTILDTNFVFGRFGEIDIIAKKDTITVFFEVKYRSSVYFGLPEESIIKTKIKKCKKTIEFYCIINHINFETIRFDVITILKLETNYKIVHYRNILA